MSKDRLRHSLDELFSDFSPPTPEGEAESSNLPPGSDVRAVADTSQGPMPSGQSPDTPEPSPEKEALSRREEKANGDIKIGLENDSSPEGNIRTWRAGWRDLASENLNGKGRTGSVRGSIGIRKRRLTEGARKSEEGEL
jgi:hypothetical protein